MIPLSGAPDGRWTYYDTETTGLSESAFPFAYAMLTCFDGDLISMEYHVGLPGPVPDGWDRTPDAIAAQRVHQTDYALVAESRLPRPRVYARTRFVVFNRAFEVRMAGRVPRWGELLARLTVALDLQAEAVRLGAVPGKGGHLSLRAALEWAGLPAEVPHHALGDAGLLVGLHRVIVERGGGQ